MPHHFSDIGAITLVASLAGIFLGWLRQLPMIGYVFAGILLGPQVLGVIDGEENVRFVAELGVILLLFILGMELPLQSFRQSYKSALFVTMGIVALSLAITFMIGMVIDLTFGQKIVYGFIISLSSTTVALKLLEAVELKDKGTGQIAIGVLIAQDLIFIPMIMILNALGPHQAPSLAFLPKIILAMGVFTGLIWYLSRKQKIHLIFHKTVELHNDLIPVAALAWCFVGAALSEWSGVTPAFGAFLAGLIIGNSHSKEKVLHRIEPMQNVLIMVFFLSIGLLINFTVIMNNLLLIIWLLLGSMIFKTMASIVMLKISLPAERWRCSFVSGLTISQIGEFSFIIAATALSKGLLDEESYKIILAVIALSLVFSPLWMSILTHFVTLAYKRDEGSLGHTLAKMLKLAKE